MSTTVRELLGAEAAPMVIRHQGKEWKARTFGLDFMTEVETYLQERDRRAILTTAVGLPAEVIAKLLEPHAEKVKQKAFRWWGPEYLLWLSKPEGIVEFCRIVFDATEAEMIALARDHSTEMALIVEQMLMEGLPEGMGEQVRDALAKEKIRARETRKETSAEDPFSGSAGS